MKSRQVFWLLLIYCTFNLQAFSSNPTNPVTVAKKVFILLRSEQNAENLQKFKSLVETNLLSNNVSAQISTYRVKEVLPQMKIFKAAYQEGYDYLLLIDQVTNYNIGLSNKKINIGGKFKIQSYNLKSSNPTWTNHGDTNCNITVVESVKQFSNRLFKTILPDQSFEIEFQNKNSYTQNNSGLTNTIDEYNISEYKLKEIKLLDTQIKLEKEKAKRMLSEIELLTLKIEKELELEVEKRRFLTLEIERLK